MPTCVLMYKNVLFILKNYFSQRSVRKGDAGKPSLLYKLYPSGLLPHAYLTATGSLISSLQTTTWSSLISADAHTNFLSLPAIAKRVSFPSGAANPLPVFVNDNMILLPLFFIDLYVGPL